MPRIPTNEIVETFDGMPIRCYDNGGKTYDRYTVVYVYDPIPGGIAPFSFSPTPRPEGLYAGLCMSEDPFWALGFGQHAEVMPGKHLGRRIAFTDLPDKCQQAVRQDLLMDSECVTTTND